MLVNQLLVILQHYSIHIHALSSLASATRPYPHRSAHLDQIRIAPIRANRLPQPRDQQREVGERAQVQVVRGVKRRAAVPRRERALDVVAPLHDGRLALLHARRRVDAHHLEPRPGAVEPQPLGQPRRRRLVQLQVFRDAGQREQRFSGVR